MPELPLVTEVARNVRPQCDDLGGRDEREHVVGLGLPHQHAQGVSADLGIRVGEQRLELGAVQRVVPEERKYGLPWVSTIRSRGVGFNSIGAKVLRPPHGDNPRRFVSEDAGYSFRRVVAPATKCAIRPRDFAIA